ncbi:MAG: hypothetical protein MZV70_37335 [Desulfobacterales bacterium]|nr:hypothetical protein [Desulfobacterales bacterium]
MPIGKGIVRREGTDVTIVATLLMMHRGPAGRGPAGRGRHQRGDHRPAQPRALRHGAAQGLGGEDRPARDGRGEPEARRHRRRDRGHRGRADARPAAGARAPGGGAEHAGPVLAADGAVLHPRRGAHRGSREGAGGHLVARAGRNLL